jgi:membrane fusion protein (multidrug efflux system)
MRTSLIALALLAAAGVLGYAVVNDKLPAELKTPLEGAMSWGRGLLDGGAPAPPTAQQASAPQPAGRRDARAPTPVEVARAESTPSESAIRSVGTLMSDESVTVSAEQTGRIIDIRFKEGQTVEVGDILVKLDDSLLQAELADARSRLGLAEGNLRRATTLSKTGAGTERASDEARSAQETARAALDLAQVRLSKTEIRAPFSGTVGLRLQSVGAFVQPGQAMVNLEKIDVLKLDFKVPELFLAQIRPGQSVEIAVDAIPDRTFTGEIYAIDPMVDVNGRALSIRARLANKDGLLRPGLFARVGIRRHAGERVVIVPEGAIVPRGSGPVVFRVQNGKALETPVRLGERRSGAVEIVSGVDPEDTVVTAGHARLRDGALVEVVASQART